MITIRRADDSDISALEQELESARRQEAYLSETIAIGELTSAAIASARARN